MIEGVGVEPATIGHNKHKHPIQKNTCSNANEEIVPLENKSLIIRLYFSTRGLISDVGVEEEKKD